MKVDCIDNVVEVSPFSSTNRISREEGQGKFKLLKLLQFLFVPSLSEQSILAEVSFPEALSFREDIEVELLISSAANISDANFIFSKA